MADQPTPQRRWQALCPGCGAPVEFASAASASAVCGFCGSTLVREGDALRRIGVVGELFDDHSPLQLGASGRHHGVAFTLVGRAQYRYPEAAFHKKQHADFVQVFTKAKADFEAGGATSAMTIKRRSLCSIKLCREPWYSCSRSKCRRASAETNTARKP